MRNSPLHEKLAFIGCGFLVLAVLYNQVYQTSYDKSMLEISELLAWVTIALLGYWLITEIRLQFRRRRLR